MFYNFVFVIRAILPTYEIQLQIITTYSIMKFILDYFILGGFSMNYESFIAQGKFNKVYKSGNLAIKVFNDGYSKSDVLHEAITASYLEELGLNVPCMRGFSEENGTYILSWDFIEGKTIMQLMDECPEKIADYMELMVKTQMSVHDHRCAHLPMLKNKYYNELKTAAISADRRIELRSSLDSTPKHIKLIHGDFNPTNVIITPEGVPYLIDTNHAAQGNASADVATSYLWFCLNRPEWAECYLDTYSRLSGTDRSYIERWLPIIAAVRLRKNLPEEREILLKWIDTYIYTE